MLPSRALLGLAIHLVSLRPLLLRTLRGGAAALPALRGGMLLLRPSARAAEGIVGRRAIGVGLALRGAARLRIGLRLPCALLLVLTLLRLRTIALLRLRTVALLRLGGTIPLRRLRAFALCIACLRAAAVACGSLRACALLRRRSVHRLA